MPTDFSAILQDRLEDTTRPRPTWPQYFMTLAVEAAQRSTCTRAKVGCTVVRDLRVISTGYNGALMGHPHCSHPDDQPCKVAVHSEANAIAFAARDGIRLQGAEMYCTLSPCAQCARLIIQAGIIKVTYLCEYREIHGLVMLLDSGVEVVQFE